MKRKCSSSPDTVGAGESSVSGFWKEAGAAWSWTLFRAGTGKQFDVIPNRLHPGTRESHHLPLLRNCRLPSSLIHIISLASVWTMREALVSTSSKHGCHCRLEHDLLQISELLVSSNPGLVRGLLCSWVRAGS